MIFLITSVDNISQVAIYDNIDQITNGIDWQDMFEGKSIVLDEVGNLYAWDASRITEYATVQGYTLKVIDTDYELLKQCQEAYETMGKPNEFEINRQK